MEEVDSQKVVEILEDVLASGLAIKPVNRIRVKVEKFIPFWENMKNEETATYFAEVILRRLKEQFGFDDWTRAAANNPTETRQLTL